MASATLPTVSDTSLHILDLKTRRKDSVLGELSEFARKLGVAVEADVLSETLMLRERVGCSALGKGVALPHARSVAVRSMRLIVARSRRGVDWDAADGPVHLVLLALSPADAADDTHHEFVARIAALGRLQRHRARLLDAASDLEAGAIVREVCG
jgi:mannitol/fructose-specific phosphotransferase system IIA component (Ntr-type)